MYIVRAKVRRLLWAMTSTSRVEPCAGALSLIAKFDPAYRFPYESVIMYVVSLIDGFT